MRLCNFGMQLKFGIYNDYGMHKEDLKNPKYEKMTPAHYMLDKEFDFFFDKIMEQVEKDPKLGIKSEEELTAEAKNLKTKLLKYLKLLL